MNTNIEPKVKITLARFLCPSCKQQIETNAAAAAMNFQCPNCQMEFVPKFFNPVFFEEESEVVQDSKKTTEQGFDAQAMIRRHDASDALEIRENARIASGVAMACVIGVVLCLIVAIYSSENGRWFSISAAAGFLMLFIGFQVIAQLLYIRARLTGKH